jgi:hypothetical protein
VLRFFGLSSIVFFAAVAVVIVVASGDPAETAALDRALRSALPEHTEISVQPNEPAETASTFVAHVEWTDHDRRAIVRTTDGTRTTEREIRFAETDAPAERGRTVGFALASMVPDELEPRPPLPEPPKPPAAPPPAPPPHEAPVPVPPPRARRFSLELLGQGATGIGGAAGGLGGALGGRFRLSHGFLLRAGMGFRLGDVPAAQATTRVIAESLGVGWLGVISDGFRVGGRVDALLIHQSVTHFSADDPEPVARGRFLPGVDARVEAISRIAERTDVMLAFGPEIALGTTHLHVAGAEASRIPPLRLAGEVGVAVAF